MTTRAGDERLAAPPVPADPGEQDTETRVLPGRTVLRWSGLVWLGTFLVLLANEPGRMVFDTKLSVDLDPLGYYVSLWHLWDPLNTLGALNNQATGYALPMAPFYLAGHLAHVPVWLTERLWMSLIIATGFAGLARLAGALGIGSPASRLLGGLVFALWPTFTIVVGSTSAATLPGMLAPWAVLPLTAAVRREGGVIRAAARSGAVVVCMGGVNATSTLDVLLLPGLFILTQARGRRLIALAGSWAIAVAMATAWWTLPLLLQGRYAFNFLPYVEQAATTTSTTSAAATLRGAGNWVAYLNLGTPWLPAGWTLVTTPIAIAAGAVAAAAGLFGLASRAMPSAAWLRLSAGLAAAGALAGYGGPLGGPFHQAVDNLLNGTLAPFRNVYKLEPVIAAALALGLAHATASWLAGAPAGSKPGRQALDVAAKGTVVVVLIGLTLPFLSGQILNPGSFTAVPRYWYQVAAFLAARSPENPALVVPADAHGVYRWGDPIDDPLEALATSPWAERGQVPYGGAGAQVLLSTAETAIESGEQVSGLSGYLQRAGFGYVVVRNDLDPGQLGYTPPALVHQTLALSGFTRVASFGPLIAGPQARAATVPPLESGTPSYPAVEVYAAAGSGLAGAGRSGPASESLSPVQNLPVSQTVLVNGGPDSLLPLTGQNLLSTGQPTLIAGDKPPVRPARWDVTDGQRRADLLFGIISANVSYTYTAHESNPVASQLGAPGGPPQQLLPVSAAGHQTVAVLSGAASVTVSSYGSWIADTQQDDPASAFDGNPATAWAEGNVRTPVGQWIQINFSRPVSLPARVGIRLLDDSPYREIASQLRVSTAAGSATTTVAATGATQRLNVAPGSTRWLRITIGDARRVGQAQPGAGISDVLIPGVRVTRLLQPAEDPPGAGAQPVFSFHQQVPAPGSPAEPAADPPMARTYSIASPVTMRLRATALALPGSGLDTLLDKLLGQVSRPGPGELQVTAATTAGTGAAGILTSLLSGSGQTPWIAATVRPVIHLSWPGKRRIDSLVVQPAAGGQSAPVTVKISSPDGTRQARIGFGGVVTFKRPLTTDRMDISFPDVRQASTVTQTGQPLTVPLGLSRLSVPALANLRVVTPDDRTPITLACGQGPILTIDGRPYRTAVSGTVGELTQYLPLQIRLCSPGSSLPLGPGRHTLTAALPAPFAVTDLSLTSLTAPAAAAGAARSVTVRSWQPDQRRLSVGPGAASYLEVHQNYNDGWAATMNGRELTPVRLDGWQQGFVVPAGPGGPVTLTFRPAASYHLALVASAAAVAVLLTIVAWSFVRLARQPGLEPGLPSAPGPRSPSPGTGAGPAWRRAWLSLLGVTALIFVTGGPVALAVPVLACLSWLLPRWPGRPRGAGGMPGALSWVALAGMIIAGLLAAAQPGGTGLLGPFGGPAQACALIALAVALLPTVPARRENGTAPGLAPPAAGPLRTGPLRTGPLTAAPPRRRFGVVDELSCYFDSPAEPNNVHLEVWLPGHLDEARLREAVAAMLAGQPPTRVRRTAGGSWRPGYSWDVPPQADLDPISVVNWRSETELDAARARFLATTPPLDRSPSFRLLRARGPEWESLILNAHHAAFDGHSCLLLMRMIADCYSDRAADSEAAWDAIPELPPAGRPRPEALRLTARIAPRRPHGRAPGYGFCLLGWPGVPAVPRPAAEPRATVNDLLVATLAETVRVWNAKAGERHQGRRIRISMPTDIRPPGRNGTLGNLSRLCTVTAEPDMTPGRDLIAAVAAQTRQAKDQPGPQVDPAMAAVVRAPLPALVKRHLLRLAVRCLGPLAADTSLLSNLGNITRPPRFGSLTPMRMWFSTSAHMPRGLSVGAVTVEDRLQLCFRYRHALFDHAAASAFADEYAAVLARLAEEEADR